MCAISRPETFAIFRYYKNQEMIDAVMHFYRADESLGYSFDTTARHSTISRYHDGKAASELHFGLVDNKAEISGKL